MVMTTGKSTEEPINNNNQLLVVEIMINGGNTEVTNNHPRKSNKSVHILNGSSANNNKDHIRFMLIKIEKRTL
jgi:hypothetical protein